MPGIFSHTPGLETRVIIRIGNREFGDRIALEICGQLDVEIQEIEGGWGMVKRRCPFHRDSFGTFLGAESVGRFDFEVLPMERLSNISSIEGPPATFILGP